MFQEFQRQSTYNISWNFEIWYSSLSKVSTKIAKMSFFKHQGFFAKWHLTKLTFEECRVWVMHFEPRRKKCSIYTTLSNMHLLFIGSKRASKNFWTLQINMKRRADLPIFPWTTTNNQSLKVWYETSFPEFWRWIVILSYYPRGEILSCNTIFLAYDSIAK